MVTGNVGFERAAYEDSRRLHLAAHAGLVGDEFASKLDRLSKLIGGAHEPSLGSYKERLLLDCIRQFLPGRFRVASGFVAFPIEKDSMHADIRRGRSGFHHEVSSQLDLIIFDGHSYAPILDEGDFVVVRPEAVRAVVEVKGFLNKSDVVASVSAFVDFGHKWDACSKLYHHSHLPKLSDPGLFLMAWRSYVDKKSRTALDGSRLRKAIVDAYRKLLPTKALRASSAFPVLNSAFIYREACVHSTVRCDDRGSVFGYSTSRGRFARFDAQDAPQLGDDKTVAELIAFISVHLDVPFNSVFAYPDEGAQPSVLPSAHDGFSPWLHGTDVAMVTRPRPAM